MPTKTDRILSYLPGTFRALPRPNALFSVTDAFGNELQQAENILAALMMSHWVDYADQGGDLIADLGCFAALYGLSPRGAMLAFPTPKGGCLPVVADESVEEFREHLKRYIRTFLGGTVTVQGVLRVVSEALGLHLASEYSQLDSWWTRATNSLKTVAPRNDGAAAALFGLEESSAVGSPAKSAVLAGTVDLSGGASMPPKALLRLAVDGAASVDVDVSSHANDLPGVFLANIVKAVNTTVPGVSATSESGKLTIAAHSVGALSRLEVLDAHGDAAPALLGLPPHRYWGTDAVSATVMGTVDLSGGIDIGDGTPRYLRLILDSMRVAEIDCAGGATGHKTLGNMTAAINAQLGAAVASSDGRFLALTAQKSGFASSIAFESAAAQDAARRLFGNPPVVVTGSDAQRARVTGTNDLSAGIDLSHASTILLSVDGAPAVEIDCAGTNRAATRLNEIVNAINAKIGSQVANQNGHHVIVTSRLTGAAASLDFSKAVVGDASAAIFGIGDRAFGGSDAAAATIVGTVDLSGGIEVGGYRVLRVSVDGGDVLEVDFRHTIPFDETKKQRIASLAQLEGAINAAAGLKIAKDDGRHLILSSTIKGSASSVEIVAGDVIRERRFVTRAFSTDDAAQSLFGFPRLFATGTATAAARVTGKPDLSRGVDLSAARALRIGIDGRTSVDVDCAAQSKRPRAALISEIRAAINSALGKAIASDDGSHLTLTSPTAGADSRISFGSAGDARDLLFGGAASTAFGRDATSVRFIGTIDLASGVDLSSADRLKIGIDGTAPFEFSVVEADPVHTSLSQIAVKINLAVGMGAATSNGKNIMLSSGARGSASTLEIDVPSLRDATATIFGIAGGRVYRGSDAQHAALTGLSDLSGSIDMRVNRFLRIAVDGGPPVDVDCAAKAAAPETTTLADIEKALNARSLGVIASSDGSHLRLTSTTTGLSSRIDLLPFVGADARSVLFGSVSDIIVGTAPTPATLQGSVGLPGPVDLTQQHEISLAVDGGRPFSVDVAGMALDRTFIDEVVAKINTASPGLASATPDNQLLLTSPTAGDTSSIELLPMRVFEVVEYPATRREELPVTARHGDSWVVVNDGAADAEIDVSVTCPSGASGIELANLTAGLRLRLMTAVGPNETLRLHSSEEGDVRAEIVSADGSVAPVRQNVILSGPIGDQVFVPFDGWRELTSDGTGSPAVTLNDPSAPSVVTLRSSGDEATSPVFVSVVDAALPAPGAGLPVSGEIVGRVRRKGTQFVLVDATDVPIAILHSTSPGVDIGTHCDRVVIARGTADAGGSATPVFAVRELRNIFDVSVKCQPPEATPVVPTQFSGVTIGLGDDRIDSLVTTVLAKSHLITAGETGKGEFLRLPRGKSRWIYLECEAPRFNDDDERFDQTWFAGGQCTEWGVFDVSLFDHTLTPAVGRLIRPDPADLEASMFAPAPPLGSSTVNIGLAWDRHAPGEFVVNLPKDLPDEFGACFDESRFSKPSDAPESYSTVVTEPPDDPDCLHKRILAASSLVTASHVTTVDIGWSPFTVPFMHPRTRNLTLGGPNQPARLYVAEANVPGYIVITALAPGVWGNDIEVTARRAGPALFDVTIGYRGARFENACITAIAGQVLSPGDDILPALTAEIVKPRPVGVVQAKAAGIRADVQRDRAFRRAS